MLDVPWNDSDQFIFPGFGMRLNFVPRVAFGDNHDLFSNALHVHDLMPGKARLPIISRRELAMLQFMNKLTDKPDWHQKVLDETTALDWKAEVLSNESGANITEKMLDWCFYELQYKARVFEKTGAISVYNGDVLKSDTAISKPLKESLRSAAALLENVSEIERGWHPELDNQVSDLVDPSLFSLVYGRTRILPNSMVGLDDCIKRSGEGVTIPIPSPQETYVYRQPEGSWPYSGMASPPFSNHYQWLPCDVDISGVRGDVRIKSYINNIHPETHKPFYTVIEDIISRTIPLWNMALTPLKSSDPFIKRIGCTACEYDPSFEPWCTQFQKMEDEHDNEFRARLKELHQEIRAVVQPEPGPFPAAIMNEKLLHEVSVDIWRDYADRGLQIIVRLVNIHLTPEQPQYKGDIWHVEGHLNEHICASAVYYYDNTNITTSRIGFRQAFATDLTAAEHADWLGEVCGDYRSDFSVQVVGTVDTSEGRLLMWPNVLQNQVQPFRLLDPMQPGHQRMIVLHLVDPNIRIISTANVPCQQRAWWSDAIRQGDSAIAALPPELQDQVFDELDFPISLTEAKKLRLRLISERKVFTHLHDEEFRSS